MKSLKNHYENVGNFFRNSTRNLKNLEKNCQILRKLEKMKFFFEKVLKLSYIKKRWNFVEKVSNFH